MKFRPVGWVERSETHHSHPTSLRHREPAPRVGRISESPSATLTSRPPAPTLGAPQPPPSLRAPAKQSRTAPSLLALVFALALALTLPTAPAQADQKGNCGTIVLPTGIGVSAGADVTALNPDLVTSLYNAQMSSMMYLGLLWINRFQQIDWSRSLASAVESPDQGTTYNITLRPWHWSDGVPVTTADIAYAFKYMKDLGTGYAGYGSGGMPTIIKSLNIISPTQFQIVLTHQVNPTWFIFDGLPQLAPLPAHAWSKYTDDQIFQLQSTPSFFDVVDGPLKVQKLDIGRDIVLVPNPNYDGPKMHFDRLIFDFLETDGATVQAYEAGDIDMVNAPLSVYSVIQHLPNTHIVVLPVEYDYNYAVLNFLNPKVAFFRDVRVRQAMADAINQQQMVALAFHGLGVAIYGPLPPTPGQFLSPQMAAGQYAVGYNPAKAIALLKEAGYTPGPDGIMQKDGKKLEFTDLDSIGAATEEQITLLVQSDLRKVGIQMDVRHIEFNQMLALLNSGGAGWDEAELATEPAPFPSGEGEFATGAFYNSGHYSDTKMDQLINDSTTKPGLDALFTYENYASAQQPVIFLARERLPVLENNRINGIQDFVNTSGAYAPDQLYCTVPKGPES